MKKNLNQKLISLIEYYNLINANFLISNTPKSLRPADIKKIGANPEKIYKDLNWKSKTSIDQIIKKMILNELY